MVVRDDPVYGFMSIRLQTWAPYEIQIALNDREWLRRSLDSNHCGYSISGKNSCISTTIVWRKNWRRCFSAGLRVRYWHNGNSVKFYNEQNMLRFEMTMNDPAKFKIYRHKENQDKNEPKQLLPMRKGIADLSARVGVSKTVVDRFTEHTGAVEDTTQFGELLSQISEPVIRNGKRHCALDAIGKDRALLQAIADPAFDVGGISNKALQEKLIGSPWAKDMTGRRLSGRISRHLALLRAHGLIRKLPKQRKYALTDKGRRITSAMNAALAASVKDLFSIAA